MIVFIIHEISKYYRMKSLNTNNNAAYQRDDGVYVVPITMLKN